MKEPISDKDNASGVSETEAPTPAGESNMNLRGKAFADKKVAEAEEAAEVAAYELKEAEYSLHDAVEVYSRRMIEYETIHKAGPQASGTTTAPAAAAVEPRAEAEPQPSVPVAGAQPTPRMDSDIYFTHEKLQEAQNALFKAEDVMHAAQTAVEIKIQADKWARDRVKKAKKIADEMQVLTSPTKAFDVGGKPDLAGKEKIETAPKFERTDNASVTDVPSQTADLAPDTDTKGTPIDKEQLKKGLEDMKTIVLAMNDQADRMIKELEELKKKKIAMLSIQPTELT